MEKNHMRTVTIQRPVVNLKATGAQIRRTSRRLRKRKLLTFALSRIGIKSQNHCTVYAWDRERRLQAGKMLQWSILSESPSSCAAKANEPEATVEDERSEVRNSRPVAQRQPGTPYPISSFTFSSKAHNGSHVFCTLRIRRRKV